MRHTLLQSNKDGLILVSRILLMILFVLFGWEKLFGFSGTVGYFTAIGAPLPGVSAFIAVVMELIVGIALVVGFWTRPLALLMALYTLGTAIIGHHYWTLSGMPRLESEINFYKNVSIIGGLILLCVTGAGKYSFDRQ
jgi:putative oxidoreductase